ncbi:hypothetical protein PoMZ_07170 [Pyricularia oryzae]|uniref:Uncharacterized protein n=1 Tax=Pyricularia oryzae TaxID=318829 RepID=A0A4P7NEG6_PYROR|nr:hypothetical protein PoMZ_07170 [Pyricularia oryzae]
MNLPNSGCLLAGAQGLALASRHTPRSLRCKRRMTCSIEPRKNNTCMGTLTNYASHNIIADAADHNQDGGWETHQHGDDTNNRFGAYGEARERGLETSLRLGSLPSPRDSFLTFGSTFDSV